MMSFVEGYSRSTNSFHMALPPMAKSSDLPPRNNELSQTAIAYSNNKQPNTATMTYCLFFAAMHMPTRPAVPIL